MIIDVHGDKADMLISQLEGLSIEPFGPVVCVSNGEDALEIEETDKIVVVANGFNNTVERKNAMQFFLEKKCQPRIMEINVATQSTIRSNLVNAAACPYTSIVYAEGNNDFFLCVSECLSSEVVISLVRDLFGEKEAELVHAFLSGARMDQMSASLAMKYIKEVKEFDDSWRDDVPVVY